MEILGRRNKTIIIAEAGVNHNGDLKMAKKLIDKASLAKADYIKFQTFKAENIVSKNAKKVNYQLINNKNKDNLQISMLKKLELSIDDHYELKNYCDLKNINFLSTAFDIPSLELLNNMNQKIYKIPSGEITNYPYLVRVSELAEKVILSTGMSNMDEIKEAMSVLIKNKIKKSDIIILHCNTEYPTPFGDVNLMAMNNIKKELGTKVGYSDHTLGLEVSLAAVSLGATVIEKHFTLNRKLPGPDHLASLEPDELTNMVISIRNIEKAIKGSGKKEISKSERKNIINIRKSIHLNKNMYKGDKIHENDLLTLRPSDGINPMDWNKVLGKRLLKNKKKGEVLKWRDIEK